MSFTHPADAAIVIVDPPFDAVASSFLSDVSEPEFPHPAASVIIIAAVAAIAVIFTNFLFLISFLLFPVNLIMLLYRLSQIKL